MHTNSRTKSTFREIIAPADLLLYFGLGIIGVGTFISIPGIILSRPSQGLTGHLSLLYVGSAICLAGIIICIVAIDRIISTNKRLKKLGLTLNEFRDQWNQSNLLPKLLQLNVDSRLNDRQLNYGNGFQQAVNPTRSHSSDITLVN